jgi:hypothetical protein
MKNIICIFVLFLAARAGAHAQSFQLKVCAEVACNSAPLANIDFPGIELSTDTVFPGITANCATYDGIPFGGPYAIAPVKTDDPLNGVNALDLTRISRHILGIHPLGSPYAMIAADVNRSNTITTFDIVESRKLIQGLITAFPSSDSWRFIDADFVFPDPDNPFQSIIPSITTITNNTDTLIEVNYKAVKVGDVDCSAIANFSAGPDDRRLAALSLPDVALRSGEYVDLPLLLDDAGQWVALQFGLSYDPSLLEIVAVVPGDLLKEDALAIAQPRPGVLNVVWFDAIPGNTGSSERLLTLRIRALAPVQLSAAISLDVKSILPAIFTANEEAVRLQLHFASDQAAPGAGAGIQAPLPNPTAGGVSIPVRISDLETVSVEIVDISGKTLWVKQIALESGTHEIGVPAQAFPEAGLYLWRATAGEMHASGKIIRY